MLHFRRRFCNIRPTALPDIAFPSAVLQHPTYGPARCCVSAGGSATSDLRPCPMLHFHRQKCDIEPTCLPDVTFPSTVLCLSTYAPARCHTSVGGSVSFYLRTCPMPHFLARFRVIGQRSMLKVTKRATERDFQPTQTSKVTFRQVRARLRHPYRNAEPPVTIQHEISAATSAPVHTLPVRR